MRKVAQLEIGDAFEVRGRIVAGMIAMMVLGCFTLYMGVKWLAAWISNALLRARA